MTNGDLLPLLNHVKSDSNLRIEVRQNGDAFIYYRRGKALEIKDLKVDKKYGNVPSTELAITDSREYFKLIKKSIDNWRFNNPKPEFDTQQNIARYNQDKDDKYIILDMEYAFGQSKIEEVNREKRGVFDLLGIERETNRIVFFELKRGMGAVSGDSGVEQHILDFRKYLFGKNSKTFRTILIKDIKNIIEDKISLGILKNFSIHDNYEQQDPELVFVFHPDKNSQIQEFANELKCGHKLIIVSDNNYKLR